MARHLLNTIHEPSDALKILVADTDGNSAAELSAQLTAQDDSFHVIFAAPGENLLAAVRSAGPDVVIVDMGRPDRDGLDSVRTLSTEQMLPVLMFIDVDDPAFMEEAIAAGVSSYHVGGIDVPAIKPILRTATAVFQRMRALRDQLSEAQHQIDARQTIEAAKRLLMTRDKMSEPAAHRFLQRRAMDQQKKLLDIATTLLQERPSKGVKRDE